MKVDYGGVEIEWTIKEYDAIQQIKARRKRTPQHPGKIRPALIKRVVKELLAEEKGA